MHKLKKYIAISIGIWLLSLGSLEGQQLDSLIAMARKNSAKVKALEAEYQASKTIGQQINVYPDPEVSIGLGILPVETRLGPQRLRLGATQMIPWPGLLKAKQALADAMSEVKSMDADNYMIEVAFQIKKAYYQLYDINKSIDLYNQQIGYLKTLKDLATTRIESGMARISDVLRIESKIIELEGKKQELSLNAAIPSYVINRFTLKPLNTPVEITTEFSLVQVNTIDNRSISEGHPQLNKLDKMKEASRHSIELTSYESKPRIGVGLDYILVGRRTDALPDNNGRDILMPMGKVSIPLSKSSYDHKRQEERLKMDALDHLKEDFIHQGNSEIQSSLNTISQAANTHQWNENLIENNNTIIELLQTAYTSSEATIDELLELYMDNIRREQAKIKAIIKSHIAKARIEKYQASVTF